MKINKTIVNTKLGNMEAAMPAVFSQAKEIFTNLIGIRTALSTTGEDAAFDLLAALEDVTCIDDIKALRSFGKVFAGKDKLTNSRIISALNDIKQIFDFAEDVLEKYIPLSEEQNQTLANLVHQGIGHLAMFLIQEFNLRETRKTLNEKIELSVDATVYEVLQECDEDLTEFVNLVFYMAAECRPRLGVFEEFPEKEEEFLAIAGDFIEEFEVLEIYLTPEIVDKVLLCSDASAVESIIKELSAYAERQAVQQVDSIRAFI